MQESKGNYSVQIKRFCLTVTAKMYKDVATRLRVWS